eukprot:scaffold1606_cov177-Pinguiococcus_pyrenoidosus.AAC.1
MEILGGSGGLLLVALPWVAFTYYITRINCGARKKYKSEHRWPKEMLLIRGVIREETVSYQCGLRMRYFRNLLRSFGVRVISASDILCDNLGVIQIVMAEANKLKAKHVGIPFYGTREMVMSGLCRYHFVESQRNIADVLTKGLSGPLHRKLVSMIFRRNKSMP